MNHVSKTLLGDRVIYYNGKDDCGHVAFVIKTHQDPHCACLTFYCPVTHQWYEAAMVRFGYQDGAPYFVNAEG